MLVPFKIIAQEELYVANEPMEIITILGSCVAVCLWDEKYAIAGMNHYLLPHWNKENFNSLKYGSVSIPKLIDRMIFHGAKKENMVAKIFGGATINIKNSGSSIGDKNISIAESILCDLNIPIVARDVGGTLGRKIILSSLDGSVYVKTST